MAIDYARMQRVWPKQKAALTRAKKIVDPEQRRRKVEEVCAATVREWDVIGAWPDDWALFERTLRDAYAACGLWGAPELGDL